MTDIFGKALLDYYQGNYSEDIVTETSISEADELSLPYLFRDFDEMPQLEQKALELSIGKILDVGCGAGSHALYLQQQGLVVTAIDVSEGAAKVARMRGVEDARNVDVLDLSEEKFDTILLLMNGSGVFQKVSMAATYLNHLKTLLQPGGQILVDSSDLQYMYDTTEEGGIWIPGDRYYGELDYRITYKGEQSAWFPMLYLDEGIFQELCEENGMQFHICARGSNYDYLAKITVREYTSS